MANLSYLMNANSFFFGSFYKQFYTFGYYLVKVDSKSFSEKSLSKLGWNVSGVFMLGFIITVYDYPSLSRMVSNRFDSLDK